MSRRPDPHPHPHPQPQPDGREADLSGMDAEDRAARALLAQYDIHLRADEPLTPALHRVAGQLKARNLPRPSPVQHTSAGAHTYGRAAPPPLETVATPSEDGSDSDAIGAEPPPPPPPPPPAADAGPEEVCCPGEAGVETKTTDPRANRARRASAGRVRPRGRSGRPELGEEQAAGGDQGDADDAVESDATIQWPDRERREYSGVSSEPVGPPPIGDDAGASGGAATDDSTCESGVVPPPSIGGGQDAATARASLAGGSISGPGSTDAAEAVEKWRRGEWRCELRETRKRSGMSLPQLGAVEYLFDMTAPSVGEEWARRWTVTKQFADFQTLDACIRALYPEGCDALPPIPKRRFSLGGFTDLSMMEGLGGTLSEKLAAVSLGSVGGGNGGSSDGSGQRSHAADKADKAIQERTKLLCGWSLCALSLAVPGGALADCHEIKEFFGPDEVDDARLRQQQRQRRRGSGNASDGEDGNGGANADGDRSARRGSIGEALSASLSRLGSFRRGSGSATPGSASEEDRSDGSVSGGNGGRYHAADGRRGSIGDRAMAALGAGMSAIRGGGGRPSSVPGPGIVGDAAVEEWAVVGVALRARHNTALTAECDAACIPGTTIPAPAVATGELRAGDDAGTVLEVQYSLDGGQLRVKLEDGWASVIAKDGTQLLEPQPRI